MKCENCGKELSPFEAILLKYAVCGDCVKKRHREVLKR
jgi:methionyl-tRNA synthetase